MSDHLKPVLLHLADCFLRCKWHIVLFLSWGVRLNCFNGRLGPVRGTVD